MIFFGIHIKFAKLLNKKKRQGLVISGQCLDKGYVSYLNWSPSTLDDIQKAVLLVGRVYGKALVYVVLHVTAIVVNAGTL